MFVISLGNFLGNCVTGNATKKISGGGGGGHLAIAGYTVRVGARHPINEEYLKI